MKGEKIKLGMLLFMSQTKVLGVLDDDYIDTVNKEAFEELDQLIAENESKFTRQELEEFLSDATDRIKELEAKIERYEDVIHEYESQEGVLEDKVSDLELVENQLIAENAELKDSNLCLQHEVADLDADAQYWMEKHNKLEQQLEEQKKYAEIGRALEWYSNTMNLVDVGLILQKYRKQVGEK